MKKIIVLLMVIAVPGFAQTLDATEALTQTLSPAQYNGQTPDKKNCSVQIIEHSEGIRVSAQTQELLIEKDVLKGSTYRWNPGVRSFLSSDKTFTHDGSRENTFRTLAVTDTTQYIVVSSLITKNRAFFENKIECVVDL